MGFCRVLLELRASRIYKPPPPSFFGPELQTLLATPCAACAGQIRGKLGARVQEAIGAPRPFPEGDREKPKSSLQPPPRLRHPWG